MIRKILLSVFLLPVLTACFTMSRMTSSYMNQIELGMSKGQVTQILGAEYTVAEKRIENGVEVEVLSYRNFHQNDEFYLFLFIDNKLEKWHREFLPKYEIKE